MNTLTITVILFAILVLVYLYIRHSKVCIKSNSDNNSYCVLPDTKENMTENVELLAQIHYDIGKLIKQLETSGQNDLANKLKSKYSRDTISEAVIQNGYTSYTVNKKNIHVCIRSRDQDAKAYDKNTLMYVILHELAHLICISSGHTDEFKGIFRVLVQNGIKAGIYKYVDYSEHNIDYCGLILTTNIVSDEY